MKEVPFLGYERNPTIRSFYTMRIIQELERYIRNGQKLLEVRLARPEIRLIGPGTIIQYNGNPDLKRRVVDARNYISFEEVYEYEDPTLIHPTMSPSDQLAKLKQMHSDPLDEQQFGVRVLELEPLL